MLFLFCLLNWIKSCKCGQQKATLSKCKLRLDDLWKLNIYNSLKSDKSLSPKRNLTSLLLDTNFLYTTKLGLQTLGLGVRILRMIKVKFWLALFFPRSLQIWMNSTYLIESLRWNSAQHNGLHSGNIPKPHFWNIKCTDNMCPSFFVSRLQGPIFIWTKLATLEKRIHNNYYDYSIHVVVL